MTKPGLYRHYKGPLYVILGTVQNSTNDTPVEQEVMVLYYSLERGINNLRVRRETEFHEKVPVLDSETNETKNVPRFSEIRELFV